MRRDYTQKQLLKKNEILKIRLQEAEDTLQAIREGAVDAVVVSGPRGEQVFTLTGEEQIYRLIVETMSEGCISTTFEGQILFCNRRFSEMLRRPMEKIIGHSIEEIVDKSFRKEMKDLLAAAKTGLSKKRIIFLGSKKTHIPAWISANRLHQGDSDTIYMVAMDMTDLETSEKLVRTVQDQKKALEDNFIDLQNSRRAALNIMKDSVAARQQVEVLNTNLQSEIASRKEIERERERLMENLSTHQTELEAQNEELRRTQLILEESRSKYSDLYDFAPVGYFMFDKDGVVIDANLTGCEMLGIDRSIVKKKPFSSYLSKDSLKNFYLHIRNVLNKGDKQNCEIVIIKKDGTIINTLLESARTQNTEGKAAFCRTTVIDITERTRFEKALRESREDLAHAQYIGSIGSWRFDVNKNILTWSDENHRIFGIPKGTQMTYETFIGTIHPDDRNYVNTKWKASIAGEDYDIEHRIIVDGKIKWIREKAYLEFDPKVDLIGSFGISQDITERKQNEEAILLAKQEWERTFDSVPDMIAILDDKHQIVRVNRAMAKQLKKEQEKCVGLPCYLAVHGTNAPPSFCPHSLTLADHKEHIAEIHDDNLGCDLLISTTPWLNEQGKIIGSVHVARDITERKRNEEQMRNLAKFPEEDPNPVLRILQDGIVAYSNKSGKLLMKEWGCNEGDSIPEKWLKLVALAQKKNSSIVHDLECGDTVYSITIAPIVSGGYANIYGNDVTKERKAEKLLIDARNDLELRVRERTNELERRAEQLARLTSELALAEHRERQRLAHILHDQLQQILAGVKIRMELLLRRVDKDSLSETKQIIQLLNESVTVSRSLTAELSPPIPSDSGLIDSFKWLARWMNEKYGLVVILDADEQANINREDLKILVFQAVRELLINVVKHAGVKDARVELTLHNSNRLRVVVSDNGVGFDHEALLSDMSHSVIGGFGLFSIRERMTTLGGRMEIDSEPKKGSRFTLIAPLKVPRIDDSSVAGALSSESKKARKDVPVTAQKTLILGRKIRVLLVDDQVVMRQGLSRLLGEEADIQVIGEASTGAEAIEKSMKLQPDVILMDFSMPDIDGVKATRLIHANAPHIRIIGLSMYEESAHAVKMMEAGAVTYITKSGKSEVLLATIRKSVEPES